MFVLKRLYSRQLAPALRKAKKDPGIAKQRKILNGETEEIEDTDFEELESDFMNVHKSHKEHVEEMKAWKEKEKYLIVKQKYFKEKYPNFLTWQDKEQIRHLHSSDPEQWSIETLAEGFPAPPDVIEKVIKGKWTKKNQNKILNHDRTVVQNWNDFKQGKLNNLPDEIKQHLEKFTNRKLNLESKVDDCKDITLQGENEKSIARGEFSEIILSYERLKNNNSENKSNVEYIGPSDRINNHHLSRSKGKTDKTLLTFKELQESVEKKVSRGFEISVEDKLLTEASLTKKEYDKQAVELNKAEVLDIVENKHNVNNNKVGFVRKTTRDMSHLIYPQKILIPPSLYKKGYTYKLNDCYYDSDGEFLYRVPGMG